MAGTLLLAAAAVSTLGACGRGSAERQSANVSEESAYRGTVFPRPLQKPDFTLMNTAGESFDFRTETEGQPTLLFFGYTHCPDVCPTTMATIAGALKQLSPNIRNRVEVVFVTTDPERDTRERLRTWLDYFNPRFIGLRGSREEVNRVQTELGLPPP
jgi:protein SCO1/2